jgi:hypothetical protein
MVRTMAMPSPEPPDSSERPSFIRAGSSRCRRRQFPMCRMHEPQVLTVRCPVTSGTPQCRHPDGWG